ncbi:MAG: hypothetical protein WC401_08755 [Bacteroidales bacterium]|jgi:hypothetical protein|nr:hypothetical protein [Bacteroidales bacterium]
MKTLLLSLFFTTIFFSQLSAQGKATQGNLVVWSDEGWIIKAENKWLGTITFKFSWVTEGTDKEGKIVSSVREESSVYKLLSKEVRQLFTAPQDPKKEITYVFKDIVITMFHYEQPTMQELIEEKKQAAIKSGQ